MTTYAERAAKSIRCPHCGCMLDATMQTSDGRPHEISVGGTMVHEHGRCVELAVIRDAVRASQSVHR